MKLTNSMKNALDIVRGLEGVTVEVCGCWAWVSGETEKHEKALESAGFRYASKKECWYLKPVKRGRGHGGLSMGAIRGKYGSVSPDIRNQVAGVQEALVDNGCYQFDLFRDRCLFEGGQDVVSEALRVLTGRFKQKSVVMNGVDEVSQYCRLKLAEREYESFSVLFLDSQHRLIEFKEMFRGTIDSCSVYPREVTKEALALNTAAVIFTHNHPSGVCEPSQADLNITRRLKDGLELFDMKVLDHIIVSGEGSVSLAQRGLV